MVNHIAIAAFQPEIALNLGNMMRTCACLDMPLHVIEPCGFPFSIKSVKRSAMDYADDVDLHHHIDWDAFVSAQRGRKILLTTKASTSLFDFQFQPGDTIIMGQESAGAPDFVHETVDARVRIDMPGGGRSLNVGVAMAMVANEAFRQVTHKENPDE